MNSASSSLDRQIYSGPPYQNLYIYYLKGRLKQRAMALGAHYIGNWEEGDSSFLFFSKAADHTVNQLLAANPQLELQDQYQMSYEDWHGEAIKPLQTEHLWIVPPWVSDNDAHHGPASLAAITLDPGVVFGSGLHPTTRDCLLALEYLYSLERPERVLDLGTGTGLLAIAALRLGGSQALAVDINHLAAQTALHNVHLNQMMDRLLLVQGRAEDFLQTDAELLIANIHFDIMQRLVETEGFLTKKWYILSGLLRSEAHKVAQMIAQRRLTIVREWKHDGIWHTYLIQRAFDVH